MVGDRETMKTRYKQSGFTFIEVMIAMLVLSVALLGIASISSKVIQGNSFSEHFTTGTVLAQDKLEELTNLDFTDSSLDDTNAGNNSTTGLLGTSVTDYQETQVDANGNAGVTGGVYTRTWNIWDRTDLTNPASRKDIAVIVTWQDATGSTRTVTVSSIKSGT